MQKNQKSFSASASEGAEDNPKEYADGKEIFIRLSAYKNDIRIDFTNSRLKSKSYATTYEDYYGYYVNNKNKLDLIDRYALPSDEKIKWAFYILPERGDILQGGTVQPQFGKNGGGIEAYFKDGTSYNTCLVGKSQ